MNYKFDIIRSHRKSISVEISSTNQITVHCPWGVPAAKINEFLDSKSRWIDGVLNRNALKLARNNDIIEYRSIYLNGVALPLVISDKNLITGEAVYVKKIEDIEKLYKSQCSDNFFKAVDKLSALTMLTPASVRIKGYKGRWGCCDSKNNLIFNFILFMLPEEVQRYVIIHELCHTLCHNHSAAFWKLVSDYEPNYKQLRARLRDYDFLTTLYT